MEMADPNNRQRIAAPRVGSSEGEGMQQLGQKRVSYRFLKIYVVQMALHAKKESRTEVAPIVL